MEADCSFNNVETTMKRFAGVPHDALRCLPISPDCTVQQPLHCSVSSLSPAHWKDVGLVPIDRFLSTSAPWKVVVILHFFLLLL